MRLTMTDSIPMIEILKGAERRRRWATAQKLAIVEETYPPDSMVSVVAPPNI